MGGHGPWRQNSSECAHSPLRLSSTNCIRNAQTHPEPGAPVRTPSHRPPAEHFGYNPIHLCEADLSYPDALALERFDTSPRVGRYRGSDGLFARNRRGYRSKPSVTEIYEARVKT
jgi:hypothetical protein